MIGAWATFEFSTAGGELFGLKLFTPGNPMLLLVGAAVAVPFGVLMALPALRLRGLYLALATMSFARMAEFVFFDQPEVFGGQGRSIADLKVFGTDISAPFTFLGIDFPRDAGFLILVGFPVRGRRDDRRRRCAAVGSAGASSPCATARLRARRSASTCHARSSRSSRSRPRSPDSPVRCSAWRVARPARSTSRCSSASRSCCCSSSVARRSSRRAASVGSCCSCSPGSS